MTAAETLRVDPNLREKVLSDPELILDDPDLMAALVSAHEGLMGENIVDMRGMAMHRLEARLDRLEDTHRNVIAAAYDNLAGTNQIHRAVLQVLEPTEFPEFLNVLKNQIAETLRVDFIKLVLETGQAAPQPTLDDYADILVPAPAGFIITYLQGSRRRASSKVILRQVQADDDLIYGENAGFIQSEACLKLDFGPGTMPGLLVLGSDDPHQFSPSQGTDLLTFFASSFERAMRRWLA
ncbi:MAG: DUF484 family protein [Planktomarina sp.]